MHKSGRQKSITLYFFLPVLHMLNGSIGLKFFCYVFSSVSPPFGATLIYNACMIKNIHARGQRDGRSSAQTRNERLNFVFLNIRSMFVRFLPRSKHDRYTRVQKDGSYQIEQFRAKCSLLLSRFCVRQPRSYFHVNLEE